MDSQELSEKWFDNYHDWVIALLENGELGGNIDDMYTRDEIIYAFMRGASIAQRAIVSEFQYYEETLKQFEEARKAVDDFLKRNK